MRRDSSTLISHYSIVSIALPFPRPAMLAGESSTNPHSLSGQKLGRCVPESNRILRLFGRRAPYTSLPYSIVSIALLVPRSSSCNLRFQLQPSILVSGGGVEPPRSYPLGSRPRAAASYAIPTRFLLQRKRPAFAGPRILHSVRRGLGAVAPRAQAGGEMQRRSSRACG